MTVDAAPRSAATAGDPDRRAGPAWRATLAQTAMELRLTARRGENLLVTFLIPVGLLLFFSAVPAVVPAGQRPVDFLVPGILALSIISTSLVNLGIATAYERSYGVLKRLGGSPLSRGGLLTAKIVSVVVVELVQTLLVLAIAIGLLGWSPLSGSNAALVAGALLLGTVAFAGLGLLMAGWLRAEATLAGANGLYLLFLLLGGIVVPVSNLPGALESIARLLPAAALSDLVRAGLGSGGDPVASTFVLAAWALGSVALAARTFHWD
ncbi:MAG TPA: ABC transporter permease [Candidatus Saccharimonadales bacterium]|nr:ABC transporter permease [Candidatus Saccharimonadales bacterium]